MKRALPTLLCASLLLVGCRSTAWNGGDAQPPAGSDWYLIAGGEVREDRAVDLDMAAGYARVDRRRTGVAAVTSAAPFFGGVRAEPNQSIRTWPRVSGFTGVRFEQPTAPAGAPVNDELLREHPEWSRAPFRPLGERP